MITCPHCGSQLSDNRMFCDLCGARVRCDCGEPLAANAAFCTNCGAQVVQPQQAAYNVESAYVQQPAPAPASPLKPKRDKTPFIIAAIIVVAAILIAAILLIVPNWGKEQQTNSVTVTTSSSSSTASSSSSSSTDSKAAQEKEYYNSLKGFYDQAGELSSDIAAAATTYNSTMHSSKSTSERTAAANEARSVKSSVVSAQNKLKSLNVPSSSQYYDCYQKQLQVYQDLYERIDVMVRAWDEAESYSNPTAHYSSIDAIITSENDSNGINIYKKDFDEVYPESEPEPYEG